MEWTQPHFLTLQTDDLFLIGEAKWLLSIGVGQGAGATKAKSLSFASFARNTIIDCCQTAAGS
jgi:hypothetical protein